MPGPWSSAGVQVNTPVVALIAAPVGAPTREKVRVFAGRSGSVAMAVNVYSTISSMETELGTPDRVGGTLTSLTVTVIAASVLATPSLTRTEKLYVPGPWASVGVQVNAPEDALILAPDGAPTKEKVSVWAGRSGSVAVAVNVSAVSSSMVTDDGTPEIVGGTFTSFK